MPTFDFTSKFWREYRGLSETQRRAFARARSRFVQGLKRGSLDPRLRAKRVQSSPGVWELTWAPDGRATFHLGAELRKGHAHVVWRRIGTHSILRNP